MKSGCAVFDRRIKVIWDRSDASLHPLAHFAGSLLDRTFGVHPQAFLYNPPDFSPTQTLELVLAKEEGWGREEYELVVTEGRITIRSSSLEGIFRGLTTLRQLLPVEMESHRSSHEQIEIPLVHIRDRPRFHWRGMHLDCGRYLYTIEEIRKFIDLLALHKINVLHWHLTDDQGWRLEIKSYPKLTEVGAWRSESPSRSDSQTGDGVPYGGYYTQEEVREIVDYARSRYVTVVPEIETPGHISAAIAAYPELGMDDLPDYHPVVMPRWGTFKYALAPKPCTFRFLEEVFGEVISLFDSPYIHVGGDEVKRDKGMRCWMESPQCRDFMKRNGLVTPQEVQGYFVRFLDDFLRKNGRKLVGWDEIVEGEPSKTAVVMAWRGDEAEHGRAAAMLGYDVVMSSPQRQTYFDFYQGPEDEEPKAFSGRCATLRDVYDFNPIPPGLPEDKEKHILGGQGHIWGEFIWDWPKVEYMGFPRICALSEVLWSGPGSDSWEAFIARLALHAKRLDHLNVNYCKRALA